MQLPFSSDVAPLQAACQFFQQSRTATVDEITNLNEQYARDIVVHGSPQLAQTLIEHDLVDELRLMVYPVIVGAGKRLFAGTSTKKKLQLAEAKTVNDGVHILVYRLAA